MSEDIVVNNKGFTLVELLAVIVMLAIILVIAIPNIMKVIDKTKLDAYKKNEELLINATRNYLAGNPDKAPINIGDIAVIDISELQSNNIIDNIKDVKSSTNCTGKITIIKKSANEYNYNPYLACGTNYKSYSYVTDGLVMHLDGYDAPVNGYWQDKTANHINAQLKNMDNTSTSGYNLSKKAYIFDGNDDYIDIPSLGTLSNLTFEIIFYREVLGDITWSHGKNTIIFYSSGNTYLNSDTGTKVNSPTFTMNLNNLYSLSVVYNLLTQKAYYYQNATLVKTVDLPLNSTTFDLTTGQHIFTNYTATSTFAKGGVYAVRIYSKSLSADEINENYNSDKKLYGL